MTTISRAGSGEVIVSHHLVGTEASGDYRSFLAALLTAVPDPDGSGRHHWWEARENGLLIAVACVDDDPQPHAAWRLRAIAVKDSHRRRGIATCLLRSIDGKARAAGSPRLSTTASDGQEPLRSLLAADGWWFAQAEAGPTGDGVRETWLKPLIPEPIEVALVGGNPQGRGGEWAQAIKRMPGLMRLVAVVDRDSATRQHWADLGLVVAPAIDALPALPIRAAVLALPPRCYAGIRSACLERGWAMLHEKPLGADLFELAGFQQELTARPVPLVAGVQRRNHPSYVALRHLIRQRLPGGIDTVSITMTIKRDPGDEPSGHRGDVRLAGGGCLVDLGYHAIDLVHYLLNAPIEPVAVSLWRRGEPVAPGQREDSAHLLARAGKTWIRIDLDAAGRAADERVFASGDGWILEADREHVAQDGHECYRCPRSWAAAECGRLAELAAAMVAPPAFTDLWEHLAALAVVERAYAMSPVDGLGLRYG